MLKINTSILYNSDLSPAVDSFKFLLPAEKVNIPIGRMNCPLKIDLNENEIDAYEMGLLQDIHLGDRPIVLSKQFAHKTVGFEMVLNKQPKGDFYIFKVNSRIRENGDYWKGITCFSQIHKALLDESIEVNMEDLKKL